MPVTRFSASSYSNTAPLIWSFLYGANHGRVEFLLDNAPSRSAELLHRAEVDAAIVPVIAYQMIDDLKLVPNVCVGAKERVRSVCLITREMDLRDVKTVALDVSSKTSVALTKLIFREFLNVEPQWTDAKPDLEAMLTDADCALLIGDPALTIDETKYRKFDLAEIWRKFTGFGFVFAMWMTRAEKLDIDLAAARDEGLFHVDEIVANYRNEIPLAPEDFKNYLTGNISYTIDDPMQRGLELYFKLAHKHGLTDSDKPLNFLG